MFNNISNKYLFVTPLTENENKDDFFIEVYLMSKSGDPNESPEHVIHNFDELLTFFEKLDDMNEVESIKKY